MTLTNQILEILSKEENVSVELYNSTTKLYSSMQFDLRFKKEIVTTYDFAAITANKYKSINELKSHLNETFSLTDWSSYEISSVDKITY